MTKYLIFTVFLFFFYSPGAQGLPRPIADQLTWQVMETNAFLHFTVNTFTGKEWGDGTEPETIFNPAGFDARKMISILKDAGFKMAIITAKHHDGFCLWPSKYTKHSVKNSRWKNGNGDIVKEIADACREYGLKFGFYLSPWDRHEASYGTPAYNEFYKHQLSELLTNYGTVSEVWFDGAKGENAKSMDYDFESYWKLVKALQPHALIFSDAGPDIRWVGNENGKAGETCWSTINTKGLAPGNADPQYLNSGDANGRSWIPPETDVSIRPGWFYHPEEDTKVKSGSQLVSLYYESVGRNSLLLLNIPPNREGQFYKGDIKSLREFRSILNETFQSNFAIGAAPHHITDGHMNTFIELDSSRSLELDFAKPVYFDRIMLQENIINGQRNEEGLLQYWNGEKWKDISHFSTIGYKRLFRFSPVSTSKIRYLVLKSKGAVQLSEVGIYKASLRE